MNEKQSGNFTVISIITAVSMAITAFVSVFIRNPYLKESISFASQGLGQDVFDLFIVSPVLVISVFFMRKGNKFWENIWLGAMVYTCYSYMIYAFGVHFNYLFLAYCAIMGLSFFGLVFYFYGLDKSGDTVSGKFKAAEIAAMIFLAIIALIFSLLWLSDIIPALVGGTLPKAVESNNFFTNPVHVMDLTFAVPACIIAIILMARRHALGAVLARVMLSLTLFMMPALGAMTFGMKFFGEGGDVSPAYMFFAFGIAAGVILGLYVRIQFFELGRK